MRRGLVLPALAVALWGAGGMAAGPASAHAGLRSAEPTADVAVPTPPTAVRLTFSEEPEPSLSTVRVVDESGASYEAGAAAPVPGDPLSLALPLRSLEQRVYTVVWRVVSRVDGHTTAGAYAFGVGVAPTAAQAGAAAEESETPAPSPLEMAGRWAYLAGLVLLVGAATGVGARFAVLRRAALVGGLGWLVSFLGLAVLVEAQRRGANASVADLWSTTVGRAAVGRAAALAAAGGGLVLLRHRRVAAWPTAVAAGAGMAVHVTAGHAAGGGEATALALLAQWAHFAAAGVWVGGLAVLLASVGGAPSADKAAAVRRFSTVAVVGVVVVMPTGVARAVNELTRWGDLTATGYGRAVLAKGGLLVVMVALGFRNRRRSVPVAAVDLRPLRRRSGGEVALGAVAVALAALLATSLPPADAEREPTGIVVSGADFARSVEVRLTLASVLAGPNRFAVRVVDGDSGLPLRSARVRLEFAPLDEPVAPSTSLLLDVAGEGYAGSGANLAVDGRWRVTVVVEHGAETVSVPLELRVRGAPQFLSVERTPGRPVRYTVEASPGAYIRVHAAPARAGVRPVHVHAFDDFGEELPVESLVVTADDRHGRAQPVPTRRDSQGRFAGDVPLHAPRTPLAIVARTVDGRRLRATVDLEVAED